MLSFDNKSKDSEDDKTKHDQPAKKGDNEVTDEESMRHSSLLASYEEDIKLQASFSTFSGRFEAVWKTVTGKNSKKYRKYYDDVVVKHQLTSPIPFRNTITFTELLNPLLIKYQFDAIEFAKGVKQTYPMVKGAVEVVFDSSLYPEKYTTPEQLQKVAEMKSLLHDNLGDMKFNYIRSEAQQDFMLKQLNVNVAPTRYGTLVVSSFFISKVRTRIVLLDNPNTTSSEVEQRNEDLRRYGPGAVIASLQMYIESREVDPSKPIPEFDQNTMPDLVEVCLYEGCISGHAPLNWLIVNSRETFKKDHFSMRLY